MAKDVFQFLWDVPQPGYQWVEARRGPDRRGDYEQYEPDQFLIDDTSGADRIINRYSPLQECSGLFRIFADAPKTQDGILEFTGKYGRLGGHVEEGIFLSPVDPNSPVPFRGERLGAWISEIEAMRLTINLWDLARVSDVEGLSRFIEWEEDDVPRYRPDPESEGWIIASWNIYHEMFHTLRPGDLIQPALVEIQSRINPRIFASPKLLWNYRRGRLDMHIVPDSLIGALWLQFAQAVDGDRKYRRCAECHTWFELSPEKARVTRLYCSNACRSKAYRNRQVEAVRLHGEGVATKEIARRFDTDTKTVSRWVKRASGTVS